MERLARSYGIEPPQVLYDVFLLRHSDQKQLPNYTRSSGAKTQQSESSGKGSVSTTGAAGDLGQFGQGSQEVWGATQMLMREQAALMQSLPFTSRMSSGGSNFSSPQTSSLPTATQSMVITTAVGDKDALMVSVPRQALTSRFRLVSRPVAPPGLMTGFHSSRSTYPPLAPRGSMLHSLARKISQKSRKLGKGKTSGTVQPVQVAHMVYTSVNYVCRIIQNVVVQKKKVKKNAVTRIRTWVISATTQCPNL